MSQELLNEYTSISLTNIKADTALPFDVYLFMERNQKLILYRKKNQQFEESKLQYFQKLKVKNFYIKNEDKDSYSKFTAQGFVDTINNENLSEEEKQQELKKATKAILNDIFTKTSGSKEQEQVEENVQNVVKNIVGNISTDSNMAGIYEKLANMISDDDSTFSHSLNVSTYAVMFAFSLGIARSKDISNIGMAAILHDIYLASLPKELIDKYRAGDELNTAEKLKIRKHPTGAEEIIKAKYKNFNAQIIYIIRQHHEQPDGKGYPLGLVSENISVLAKILAIADLFDNTVRKYKVKGMNPSPIEVFSYMKENWSPDNQIIDMDLFDELIREIGVNVA